MANTFLTPSIIAREALATLYDTTVMAQLVHRDYDVEFTQHVGDTITVRKPTVFTANEFNPTNGITVQDADETSVDITLNHHADVSFAVTTKDLALNIQDFAGQLLNPALEAINQKIDSDILALLSDITQTTGDTGATPAAPYAVNNPRSIAAASAILTQKAVPMLGRNVVAGPLTTSAWVTNDLFLQAQQAGSTAGLREASLGPSVFNATPYQTQHIAQGAGKSEVNVLFHPTAFALAFRPLPLPMGSKTAAIQSYKGFSIRVVYDYDITKKQDVISLDVLYGCKTLDPNRACLIQSATAADYAGGGSVSVEAPRRARRSTKTTNPDGDGSADGQGDDAPAE